MTQSVYYMVKVLLAVFIGLFRAPSIASSAAESAPVAAERAT